MSVRIEIEFLFERMKEEVKKHGLRVDSFRGTRKHIPFSQTIGDYRIMAMRIARVNLHQWDKKDRLAFTRGFGRKTTPYFFLKKELF